MMRIERERKKERKRGGELVVRPRVGLASCFGPIVRRPHRQSLPARPGKQNKTKQIYLQPAPSVSTNRIDISLTARGPIQFCADESELGLCFRWSGEGKRRSQEVCAAVRLWRLACIWCAAQCAFAACAGSRRGSDNDSRQCAVAMQMK